MTNPRDTAATSLRPVLAMAAALLVAGAVYWPGLSGGFIFDDLPFIVENPAIQGLNGTSQAWLRAIFAFPVEHQGRWLGMLSFAINAWLHGFQPLGFKAVNLAIHLVNGVLVWLVVRRLARVLGHVSGTPAWASANAAAWLPVAVAALWLVLPINLTAVLYVVQRFESLSTLFIFLGIAFYLGWRIRFAEGRGGLWGAVAIVGLFAVLGAMVKESALLLPLYTAAIEVVVLQQASQKPLRRPILALYAGMLGVPFVVGAVWYLGWAGGASSYPRHFTTLERVLTEFRVLFMYMDWTLLPAPSKLALFHDDVALSRSLLTPPTTLMAAGGHVLMVCAAIFGARRWPLVCVGTLLFYAGHVMTGTVVPLEIVFEHRNYLPSVGILLAAAAVSRRVFCRIGAAYLSGVLATIFFIYYAGVTVLRASEWGDPLLHAATEVQRQPGSERAINIYAYELLRISGGDPSSEFHQQAMQALERCSRVPGSTITCDAALIMERERIGAVVGKETWGRLLEKLRSGIPRFSDMNSLSRLVECHVSQACRQDRAALDEALAIARDKPIANQILLNASARFAYFVKGDAVLAEKYLVEAVDRNPEDPRPRIWLATLYLIEGRRAEAESALDRAEALPRAAYAREEILSLRAQLASDGIDSPEKH
ncbi:MAG: tetratricopeptide repeat protein [Rhodanobacteraceae bacterium]|nr:tetratricopeptide repeat protein [Rhodanobacteraceae bacterium]